MLSLSLLPISTFFEYEMKISFISIVSRLKNMEDYIDEDFKLRDTFNNNTFINMNTNQN